LILVLTDRYQKKFPGTKPLDLKGAILMGCFQACAMIPGISRSGGIFVGGLMLKYRREDVVDFAFMLAVPTIAAATVYDLYKVRDTLSTGSNTILLIGGVVAFISAFVTAKWFIDFTKKNGIAVYGYYRMILAAVLLLTLIF
jgi:undecaprenyl-diphosphatase